MTETPTITLIQWGTFFSSIIAALGVLTTLLLNGNRRIAEYKLERLDALRTDSAKFLSLMERVEFFTHQIESLGAVESEVGYEAAQEAVEAHKERHKIWYECLEISRCLLLEVDSRKAEGRLLSEKIRESVSASFQYGGRELSELHFAACDYIAAQQKSAASLMRNPFARPS
ncbi:MAG: hypothetical protein AAGH90_07965 [Pseudomonadota bacterium]